MSGKIERVKALLRQAADPGATIAEREVFMNKATELIAKHGIDVAQLAEEGKVEDPVIQKEFSFKGSYQTVQALLLARIAYPLRCQTVRWAYRGKVSRFVVVGHRSDVERVELLYATLLPQLVQGMNEATPDYYGTSTRGFRIAWGEGFGAEINRRLNLAERKARTEADEASGSNSTALVLLDRNARVEAQYKEWFPGVTTVKLPSRDPRGYRAGRQAGERADMGGNKLGGQRTGIER